MGDNMTLLHTGICIVGVIALIIWLKIHPLFSLFIGAIYLGLAAGLGFEGTIEAVSKGFGDLMADIGMLIMFGILLGGILFRLGAIDSLVALLMRISGKKLAPYALGVTTGTALQSIFSDVILVITAPIGRNVASRLGKSGIGVISAAICAGTLVGLTMMIPSVGSLALSNLVGVPIPRFLILGLIVSVPTILITIWIMRLLFVRFNYWSPETDEDHVGVEIDDMRDKHTTKNLPLWLTVSPIFLALALIATQSMLDNLNRTNPFMAFIGTPMVAMFLATFLAAMLLLFSEGQKPLKESLKNSFGSSGEILALTGLGGSLAQVVKSIGLGDTLGKMFEADAASPIILAWVLAVVLHIAIGSVSVASITAAGFLAPVASSTGVDPVLIALSAAAGSLFLMTVHSNFFWMAKTMLNQSTKGAMKSVSLTTCVASVVGLALVYVLAVFI